MLLTRQRELARKQKQRELRRLSNDGIKILNSAIALRTNPFAGDTTTLPFDKDGKTDKGGITEDDVLYSVINAEHRQKHTKTLEELNPDLVCDAVKTYYKAKMQQSILKNARAKSKID